MAILTLKNFRFCRDKGPDQPFVERVAGDDAVGVDRWDPGDDHRPV